MASAIGSTAYMMDRPNGAASSLVARRRKASPPSAVNARCRAPGRFRQASTAPSNLHFYHLRLASAPPRLHVRLHRAPHPGHFVVHPCPSHPRRQPHDEAFHRGAQPFRAMTCVRSLCFVRGAMRRTLSQSAPVFLSRSRRPQQRISVTFSFRQCASSYPPKHLCTLYEKELPI